MCSLLRHFLLAVAPFILAPLVAAESLTVSTLAGSPGLVGSADGAGSAARFNGPSGIAADSAGNVYVADTGNYTIRKVTSGGEVTTLAGLAGLWGSADGTGSAARFTYPWGVATDSAGNVYVADANDTIRKVTPGGVVTTLAGSESSGGSADGTGSAARFYHPTGVAADSAGNVYVADSGNHTIRKVTPGGVVSTIAGFAGSSGSADGTGNSARFNLPWGVATDSAGNVYVADTGNFTIRKVTPGGVVTTLAGLAGWSGSADGSGSAARFYTPQSVGTGANGNVYVADYGNNTVRLVTPSGVVTTVAGTAGTGGFSDGVGNAARFFHLMGVAVDRAGTVFIADYGNQTIRSGTVSPGGNCGGVPIFVPAAAHASGVAGSVWRTDLAVWNGLSQTSPLSMRFLSNDQDNSSAPCFDVGSISAGSTMALDDVVKEAFGINSGLGGVALYSTSISSLVAASRTFNQATTGTFGQGIPARNVSDAIVPGVKRRLFQLHENDAFRTNVGLLNVGNTESLVDVSFFDSYGVLLGTTTYTLLPYSLHQETQAFKKVTSRAIRNGRADILVRSGAVLAYASVVDNATGDPTYVEPR